MRAASGSANGFINLPGRGVTSIRVAGCCVSMLWVRRGTIGGNAATATTDQIQISGMRTQERAAGPKGWLLRSELLFRDQALHEFGFFLLIGLNAFN